MPRLCVLVRGSYLPPQPTTLHPSSHPRTRDCVQEITFKKLDYQHPTVMSFLIAFVSMGIGAAGGGFRDRKAPLRSNAAVGILR